MYLVDVIIKLTDYVCFLYGIILFQRKNIISFFLDQFDIHTIVVAGENVNFTKYDGNQSLTASPDTFLTMQNLRITGGNALMTICEVLVFSPRKYVIKVKVN